MERLRVIVEDSGAGGCGSGCGCATGAAESAMPGLSLSEAAEQLSAARGPRYWKSFEELAATPAFDEMLEREFPRQAMEFGDDGVSRRRFLQLSGASLALGGLTACTRQPTEPLVPYVNQPEYMVANQAQYYATAFPLGGYAHGVLAKSHMGRPIKIEGNPDHPSSRGGTDLFAQASILSLYDPDRSQSVVHLGGIRTWADFTVEIAGRAAAAKALRGQGLRILTGNVTSPTLGAQIQALLSAMPEARWHQWEPAGAHHAARGAQRAFGAPAEVHFDLSQADVVVALEADFLTQGPGAVRYAFDWSERRRVSGHDAPAGNRLYCLESMPTSTGTVADHRLALAPREVARFAAALAAALGVPGAAGTVDGEAARWVQAVAADLRAAGARTAVPIAPKARWMAWAKT